MEGMKGGSNAISGKKFLEGCFRERKPQTSFLRHHTGNASRKNSQHSTELLAGEHMHTHTHINKNVLWGEKIIPLPKVT